MNETMEADVDAKGTVCKCCGDELNSKQGNQICSDCTRQGCDPSTSLCLKDLGGA